MKSEFSLLTSALQSLRILEPSAVAKANVPVSKPQIHDDPCYLGFAERYGADLCAFAEEVCGAELDEGMRQSFRAMSSPTTRMVLSEAVGPRVSRLAAMALWAVLFHPRNEVVVVAPRNEIHRRHAEFYRHVLSGPHCWVGEYLRVSLKGVRTSAGYEGPRVIFLTAIAHSPENLAGFYGGRTLFLVEGASVIDKRSLQVLRASIREPTLPAVVPWAGFDIAQTTDQAAP